MSPLCAMVEKPAVLNVTDWNIDARIFCGKDNVPSVPGLLYSEMKKYNAPTVSKIPVIPSASLEWSDHLARLWG